MLMTEWNWDDALAYRYKEGHAEGRYEGRAEGIAERNVEIARKMKEIGFSAEQIKEVTGLTSQRIAEPAYRTGGRGPLSSLSSLDR